MVSALTLFGLDEMMARYASYEGLAEIVRHRFTRPAGVQILYGNTDDHARNHAAWQDADPDAGLRHLPAGARRQRGHAGNADRGGRSATAASPPASTRFPTPCSHERKRWPWWRRSCWPWADTGRKRAKRRSSPPRTARCCGGDSFSIPLPSRTWRAMRRLAGAGGANSRRRCEQRHPLSTGRLGRVIN